jgi:hypothetical protein
MISQQVPGAGTVHTRCVKAASLIGTVSLMTKQPDPASFLLDIPHMPSSPVTQEQGAALLVPNAQAQPLPRVLELHHTCTAGCSFTAAALARCILLASKLPVRRTTTRQAAVSVVVRRGRERAVWGPHGRGFKTAIEGGRSRLWLNTSQERMFWLLQQQPSPQQHHSLILITACRNHCQPHTHFILQSCARAGLAQRRGAACRRAS